MIILRQIISSLAAGYILFFYSERVFWARYSPEDNFADLVLTWAAYSVLAFLFLGLLEASKARTWYLVFLCGAVFGWLGEGAIAGTMFDLFPLQISWTGLAWHTLISVMAGWYAIRRAYLAEHYPQLARLAVGLGVFWGVWALWWVDELPAPIAPDNFITHTWIISLLLILAHWVYELTRPSTFHVSRLGWIIASLFPAGWYALVILPTRPWSILILAPLLGVTLYALLRGTKAQLPIDDEQGSFSWQAALALLLMPLSATVVYLVAYSFGLFPLTNVITMAITAPLGFIGYGVSLYMALRSTRDLSQYQQS